MIRNPIRGFDAEITKLTDMRQLYPNQNKCEIEEHQKDFFLINLRQLIPETTIGSDAVRHDH